MSDPIAYQSPVVNLYVKLPIPVEAICFMEDGWDFAAAQAWCPALQCGPSGLKDGEIHYEVNTLENPHMKVKQGDYIIKGVSGEFYPCRKDIFLKSYTKQEED